MVLDQWKTSNAWDSLYNLPLCPGLNNPWLYMAYADMLMRLYADNSFISPVEAEMHFQRCEAAVTTPNPAPGLFMRWPNGQGGQTSYDEILGAAYLSPWIARRILTYLDLSDGEFYPGAVPGKVLETNVYRFFFIRPFLVAASGLMPSLISQFIWCLCLLFDALTRTKTDQGGALKFWLMSARMEKFPLCSVAVSLYKRHISRIMTPKDCFLIEPKECPIYAETAPVAW